MGFLDSFFGDMSDPIRAAQLRGGLIGAGQALAQPYGNLGTALIGGATGAQSGQDRYMQQQQTNLGLANTRLGLQQKLGQANFFRQQSGLPPITLDDMMKGNMGSAAPAPSAAPAIATAPQAPVQAIPQSPVSAQAPNAAQAPMPSTQAHAATAPASQPVFHLPPGFDSPEQFAGFANAFPDEAVKRMFPTKEFDKTPRTGVNPATGKPEEYVMDNFGNPKWLGIQEAIKQNPNEPFNADGTPNKAYQAYKAQEMRAQQAPQWARVALERENAGGKGLTAPMTVEAADPRNPGQRTQFLAQQDKATGQWVTGDQSRLPLTDVMLPGGVPGGGRAAAQVGRMMGAAKDVSTGLQNVSELPITASTGMMGLLGGKQEAHTLMDATKTVLANQMTPQEVQSTKAMYVGIAKAIGTLDAGGLQTSDTFLKQIGGLLPAEGDTHMTKLLKLAELRQQADNALESQLNGPLLSSQQKVYAKKLRDSLAKSIPFTPLDVLHLDKSPNPQAKISDYAKGAGLGGGGATSKMLPKPKTPADAAKLPPGTHFLDGNGVERVR